MWWGENLGAENGCHLPSVERAGFEPCVRVASAQRVVDLTGPQHSGSGTSTERLKSGAGKSWEKNYPGRAEIFAPPDFRLTTQALWAL